MLYTKEERGGGVGVNVGGFFNLYTAGHPITPSKSICIFAEKCKPLFFFTFFFNLFYFFRRRRFVSQIYPR